MTPLIDRVKTDLKIEDGETSSLETKVDEEEQSPEEPKETTVPCFVETKKRPSDDATPHYPPQPESRVLTADQRQQLMELAEQVSGSGSAKLVLGLAAHQTAVGLLAKDAPPISEAYEYGDLDFFKDFDPIKAIQVAKQMIREAAKRNNSGVGLLRLCFMGLSKEEQARVQLVCNEEYERAGKLQSVAVKILEEADRKVGGSEGVKPGETGGAPKKPNKARPPKPVEKRESAIKIEDLSGYPGKSNECLPWTRWGSSVPGLAVPPAQQQRQGATRTQLRRISSVTVTSQLVNSPCSICKQCLKLGSLVWRLPCGHLVHPLCAVSYLDAKDECAECGVGI